MYKILLVDDEYLELEMLERHVPWEYLGFEVTATARNGRDALARAKELHPDIIITDIKMPIMDGIEFSKLIHSSFPETKIIFLSGYNQFEYLKSAFQVEAVDFLLKPIELDELQRLMSSVKEKCDAENQKKLLNKTLTAEYIKETFLTEGNEEWHKSINDIRRLCNGYLGCPPENDRFNALLMTIDEYRFLSEYKENDDDAISLIRSGIQKLALSLKALLFSTEENKYIIMTSENVSDPVKSWKAGKPELQKWVTVCFSDRAIKIDELPGTYGNLNRLRDMHVRRYGPGRIIVSGEDGSTAGEEGHERRVNGGKPDIGLLLKFIQQSNYNDAVEWIDSFYSLQSEEISNDCVYSATFDLIDMIYEVFIIPNGTLKKRFEDRSMLYKRLLTAESLPLVKTVVNKFIRSFISALETIDGDPYQIMVSHIKEFIEENYWEPLTIESLKEKFYFSPNYLRAIFKKYTGITPLEHITNVRLQHAVRLLRETPLKVHEISPKIGYVNPSYFCAIFMKKFGVTPNEYRNRLVVK